MDLLCIGIGNCSFLYFVHACIIIGFWIFHINVPPALLHLFFIAFLLLFSCYATTISKYPLNVYCFVVVGTVGLG